MKARVPDQYKGGKAGMNAILKQAEMMQEQINSKKEELAGQEFTGHSASELVTITMTGAKEITSVQIKPEAVDPDDIDLLCDLVKDAVNKTYQKVEEVSKEELDKITGGLDVPGL